MKALSGIFGGGNDEAEQAAREQQQLQAVANDRQLAEVNRDNTAIAATRRAPRGRRLFEDGPAPASAKTLGDA